MASTPSTIGNVEQIGIGDQLNSWGGSLNSAIDRMTEMGVGVTSISLTGNKTLTTTNYVANESRWGGIRFTDGGLSSAATVTFPAETRSWLVINTGSTYAVNCLAAGSGVSAVSVAAGKWAIIDCDGTDMFIRDLSNMGGDLALSSIADIASARVIGNMSGSTAAPSLITVYDEDNMASNSATGLATQQSIKAYVDTIASSGDLATVAGIASEITTVADIEDGTVATNAVTDVAGIASNVTTVAGISGNVTTVAGISANVTTVAGISANVTTVAGDSADIQALGPISANITTVAGISSDVTTVAADATDIGTVSTNIASVNTCATNIVDIQNAAALFGDVVQGPGSSTNNYVPQWNGTTGQLLKDGLAVGTSANNLLQLNGSGLVTVPNGGTGAASFTDGGVLVGNSTGAIQATAAGTSGQVLTSNGAGVDPTFQDPAVGGSTLIEAQTVSSPVAAVDFTTGIDSTYKEYVLVLINVIPATDGVDLRFRASTDGGSTYLTSNSYSYVNREIDQGGTEATDNFSLASQIQINGPGAVGSDTNENGVCAVIRVQDPAATSRTHVKYNGTSINEVTSFRIFSGGGLILTTSAVDAFRFLFSSGNIESGSFYLYGRKIS